jgi:hypothetical protein
MSEDILTYDELFVWRNVCEFLHRFGALDRGKWTEFGIDSASINLMVKNAYLVIGFDARPRRQLLWDAWRIQLIRYVNTGWVAKKNTGWVLKYRWEEKIDFLEQVVLFNADPYDLPMPWLRDDMPKPWDAVIGIAYCDKVPKMGDMVLSGEHHRSKDSLPKRFS